MTLVAFIVRRLLWAIPMLFAVSLIAFVIIQLPPGDFITALSASLAETGDALDTEALDALRERYGLDQHFLVQYWKWISGVVVGDFGMSFEWGRPVAELIWGAHGALSLRRRLYHLVRLGGGVAHRRSIRRSRSTRSATTSSPRSALSALPSRTSYSRCFCSTSASFISGPKCRGCFLPNCKNAPWSFAKVLDLLSHLWIPMVILGTSSAASLIRIMRANLLDELHKPYVTTARAKGLSEFSLLIKYPVRLALSPFVSTIGWAFPHIISGSVITDVVLSLPTAGPLMLQALKGQDMYLAGGFVLLLCCLSVVGMLVSDILLGILDPRIRYR